MNKQAKVYVDQLNKSLARIEGQSADSFTRSELGVLGFDEARDEIEAALGDLRAIRTLPLTSIPEELLRPLAQQTNQLVGALDQLIALNPSSNNLQNERNNFLRRLGDDRASLIRLIGLLFGYFGSQDAARIREHAAREASKIHQLLDSAEAAVSAIRSATAEQGVEQHADIFAAEAKNHQRWAKYWLWASAILFGLLGVAAFFNLRFLWTRAATAATEDAGIALELIAGKLILFSALSFSVVWASRNYRAHRHNAVLNRHRSNALATFQTFVEGTAREDIRDAVLLRATEAVFGTATTGYLAREPDSAGSGQVIEVVRGLIGKPN